MGNLVENADFRRREADNIPRGWVFYAPRQEIAPNAAFDPIVRRGGEGSLKIWGNGDPLAFGAWTTRVRLEPDKYYRGSVYFKYDGIDDPNLSILINLHWGDENRLIREEYFSEFTPAEEGWIKAEHLFRTPKEEGTVNLQLYFRASPNGRVWFADPEIVKGEAPKPRLVKVATTYFEMPNPSTRQENIKIIAERLDEVGKLGVDIVVVPEMVTCRNVAFKNPPYSPKNVEEDAETEGGPASQVYCEKAKKYGMWVLGWIHERDGKRIFNTVLVINREGRVVGKYRKIHLHWPEEWLGVSPGMDIPVFETDFGKIGVIICYDGWFPALAQNLAMKGAEILFFPSAGYTPYNFQTRCVDTTTYGVSSSFSNPSMIVGTDGEVLAQVYKDGVATATVDLSKRPTNKVYDSPSLTYGCPGACRLIHNTLSRKTEEEVLAMLKDPFGPPRPRWK
ncbi:MAG: carbon-nitrogen hydrolase family protein [Candidatus Bathyarchaeia archaeon]